MKRILVTGANRGIGLEFTRQYLRRGDRVFAACRDPQRASELYTLQAKYVGQMTIVPLDVADQASIGASYRLVAQEVSALDVLINNAGVYNAPAAPGQPVIGDDDAPQTFGVLDFENALAVLRINAIAPAIMTQHYVGLLKGGDNPCVVNISSGMGSISDSGGGSYYYGTSKAALNMISRKLAMDLRRTWITVVAMDPGWVQTDMGGESASLTPQTSVRAMVAFIDKLSPAQTGGFYDHSGKMQPW
ncbi:MAG: SDR family oxidoreductase [Chitinophagaceae bacterium]|nr:SDR family oxidoreductase [Anaerolineae bacterium]